ncbi:MAG TPA: M18 family aminopeptidase [Polyangiaceae bacterium]|nr:M18 family aminopeptidase [Polyangiaceae bacterium]
MQAHQAPLDAARDLLRFIQASPTPCHAVAEVERRLAQVGFRKFQEQDGWELQPGTRGYVTRAGSIIGFIAGDKAPAESGFVILGAHTDSPNLRVRPRPDVENLGYRELGVEVYGGVLLSTWMDRDLGLAGRVVTLDGVQHLLNVERPLFRIPNLAIHLNRDVNKEGLQLNAQQHLIPVTGLESKTAQSLNEFVASSLATDAAPGVTARDIGGYELCLYDLQAGSLGGGADEFLFSARLDNLASCHAACSALVRSGQGVDFTRLIALYDHEEVGSQSSVGARSQFIDSVLLRLVGAFGEWRGDALPRALARSLLVSADMAHAVHPNYADKHDKQHRPVLGAGPVIKVNSNQSYATGADGAAAFVRACRAAEVEPQYFVARNDMPCGSTIGPILSSRLGVRGVDVGNPMLSMHSCREMAATADVEPMIRVFERLFSAPR